MPVLKKTKEINEKNQEQLFQDIIKCLYGRNIHKNGKVNSCEFFYEEKKYRILNSNGIDNAYKAYSGQIELVVDWKEESEESEVFTIYNFADFDKQALEKMTDDTFAKAKGRALAQKAAKGMDCPVILTGEAITTSYNFV